MRPVIAYDTTLRDGSQQEGISLTVDNKLAIATLLDELGVDYIEGGWPGAIPKDTEFFGRALAELDLKHARLAAFGATCRAGTAPEQDPQVLALLACGAPTITLVAKSDIRHVEKALRTDATENLRMVRDTVTYLVSQGVEVMVDLEHFFDGLAFDDAYGLRVMVQAAEAGAAAVIMCDTNGGGLPGDIEQASALARKTLDQAGFKSVQLGIHAHNDTGCAVANSLAAVQAGASQVQGTINGYGERTGNANLCTLIANLQLKLGMKAIKGQLADLSRIAHAVSEVTNIPPFAREPYVGVSAFAHKAGLHASAIRVDADLYQHIDPALVGNDMRMLVSEMAGRASIELKGKELGFDLAGDNQLLGQVTKAVKEREAAGYTYDAADASFELLLLSQMDKLPVFFEVESWRALVSSRMTLPGGFSPLESVFSEAEATVKVVTSQGRSVTTGEGNGPVNALDAALRQAIVQTYPIVASFELIDYKVRILDQQQGTDAIVRVLIETTDGRHSWSTVGVGSDLIQASWEALSDSVRYGLIYHQAKPLS